jgi:hypothetical protein
LRIAVIVFARPKSSILTRSSRVTKTVHGSRVTWPLSWRPDSHAFSFNQVPALPSPQPCPAPRSAPTT